MAITKRVIILEQTSAAPPTFRYLMWADVPATRQAFYAVKQAGMTSAWKDAATADNTALQNGSVTESVDIQIFPNGTTLAQAEAVFQTQWTAFQAAITANNPWLRYGTFMNISNAWTAGGVT